MSDETKHKAELNDSTKLAIREEVEKRLGDDMPGKLSKYIDDEVEKRVALRVSQYKTLIYVIATMLTISATIFGKVLYDKTLATARDEATKQIAGAEAVKAGQKIIDLQTEALTNTQMILSLTDSASKTYDAMVKRLDLLRQQDNVVLRAKDGSVNFDGTMTFDGQVNFSGETYFRKPVWFTDSVMIDRTDGKLGALIFTELGKNGTKDLRGLNVNKDGQVATFTYPH